METQFKRQAKVKTALCLLKIQCIDAMLNYVCSDLPHPSVSKYSCDSVNAFRPPLSSIKKSVKTPKCHIRSTFYATPLV